MPLTQLITRIFLPFRTVPPPILSNVSLAVCLFHARSVVNKVSELQQMLCTGNYDMLFITETQLHTEIPSCLLDVEFEMSQ